MQNKLGAYVEAGESAGKALEVEGAAEKDLAKAYFRRAQARVGRKNDEEAVKDLESAAKYAPGDAAIARELEGVKKRVSARREKEKKAYKNAFNF